MLISGNPIWLPGARAPARENYLWNVKKIEFLGKNVKHFGMWKENWTPNDTPNLSFYRWNNATPFRMKIFLPHNHEHLHKKSQILKFIYICFEFTVHLGVNAPRSQNGPPAFLTHLNTIH